jgi:hypothetical protein
MKEAINKVKIKEIEQAEFKRDLNKLFYQLKEEYRIRALRRITGWRKPRSIKRRAKGRFDEA